MRCVLAEAERLYGAHGVPFFTLSCAYVNGKKEMRFPKSWQRLGSDAPQMRTLNKNAVCVRTGYCADERTLSLVVVDADGDDAIATFTRLAARAGVDLAEVPRVQTQRGPSGRHYYFRACSALVSTMRSGAKLVIDGAPTSIDIRAGSNGEGVGCVLAPPTVVVGGGAYTLIPGSRAIHEAPPMPDGLARALLGASLGASPGASPGASLGASRASSISAPELCAVAVREARMRAGTDRIGTPVRVLSHGVDSVRVEFGHTGARVCPVSRNEHRSNHFNVILHTEARTGLPALFVYCHSSKEGCKAAGHRMLCYLDEAEGARLFAESGLDALATSTTAPAPGLGQATVAIGEAQKAIDRLVENTGAEWAGSFETVGIVACALCTLAAGHAPLVAVASLMFESVLDATRLNAESREVARRAFVPALVPFDALAALRGFASGLNGKREQELMVIREAIVACTDPGLEADVPSAAESMLAVLELFEYKDETTGRVEKLNNIPDLGMFVFYIWRRIARYGFDKTQSSQAHQWTFYLFNGATYVRGQWDRISIRAKEHIYAVIRALCESPSLRARAKSALARCYSSDYISRALSETQMSFKHVERLEACGLVDPEVFERKLDMGNYIGFSNGVYDILNDRFLPKGRVPLNVLVSMCTNYDYVGPDDPKFPEMRAQIEEFYRKLHADDYGNPNDERLAAMWLLAGSLLVRGNEHKKAVVFFGDGDSGKTTLTNLITLTLGDYAADGAGTEGPAAARALVCVYPDGGAVSCARDRGKPLMQARARPPAERWIVPVEFGSTLVAGLEAQDPQRRRYPRKQVCVHEWAPYHFVLMLEAYRAYRAVGYQALEAVSRAPLSAPNDLCFRSSQSSRSGAVYAFVTPSMPGIAKIGATTRELAERLREANGSDTWRPPEPYVVACATRVNDAFAAERLLHSRLSARRVSARSEFFRLTVEETRAVFRVFTPGRP